MISTLRFGHDLELFFRADLRGVEDERKGMIVGARFAERGRRGTRRAEELSSPRWSISRYQRSNSGPRWPANAMSSAWGLAFRPQRLRLRDVLPANEQGGNLAGLDSGNQTGSM
jgi:hypothetical protein